SSHISSFQSAIDPSLSITQQPPCKWLEENIDAIPRANPPPPPPSTNPPPKSSVRSAYETELLSHLPKKELVDELVSVYFTGTDVCHATFRPAFNKLYNQLWSTPKEETVNVPFLGVLFS